MTNDERIAAVLKEGWRIRFDGDGETRSWTVSRIVKTVGSGQFIRVGYGDTLHKAWTDARDALKPDDVPI